MHHKIIPAFKGAQFNALAGDVKDLLYFNHELRPWLTRGPDFSYSVLFAHNKPETNQWKYWVLEEFKEAAVSLTIRTIPSIDPYLFIIPGDNQEDVLLKLEDLERQLSGSQSLLSVSKISYTQYISRDWAYICCLLGKDRQELSRELIHVKSGINEAFQTGKNWSSPNGSYFTTQPLGPDGVAFVYPGAFNSYPAIQLDSPAIARLADYAPADIPAVARVEKAMEEMA